MDARGPSPQEIAQMWDAGARSLAEGWRQGQEFWNSAARNWAEMSASWMRQPAPPGPSPSPDAMAAWRELQDAASGVPLDLPPLSERRDDICSYAYNRQRGRP